MLSTNGSGIQVLVWRTGKRAIVIELRTKKVHLLVSQCSEMVHVDSNRMNML